MSNINLEKVSKMYDNLKQSCNIDELMWLARNLSYAFIYSNGTNDKADIYDGKHSQLNIEQANMLQRQLSAMCDLFAQSINGREFDKDYLRSYEIAGPYLNIITEKNKEINDLEETISKIRYLIN